MKGSAWMHCMHWKWACGSCLAGNRVQLKPSNFPRVVAGIATLPWGPTSKSEYFPNSYLSFLCAREETFVTLLVFNQSAKPRTY